MGDVASVAAGCFSVVGYGKRLLIGSQEGGELEAAVRSIMPNRQN